MFDVYLHFTMTWTRDIGSGPTIKQVLGDSTHALEVVRFLDAL